MFSCSRMMHLVIVCTINRGLPVGRFRTVISYIQYDTDIFEFVESVRFILCDAFFLSSSSYFYNGLFFVKQCSTAASDVCNVWMRTSGASTWN